MPFRSLLEKDERVTLTAGCSSTTPSASTGPCATPAPCSTPWTAIETVTSRSRHVHAGKVRDLYDAGDGRLLMVASDRLSAFDVVMAEPVPTRVACSRP